MVMVPDSGVKSTEFSSSSLLLVVIKADVLSLNRNPAAGIPAAEGLQGRPMVTAGDAG
jgi:hypothetical protein